ncbi:hypothetical protein GGI42DRAFT_292538 [Trichoderma sp. SZMC 28013]
MILLFIFIFSISFSRRLFCCGHLPKITIYPHQYPAALSPSRTDAASTSGSDSSVRKICSIQLMQALKELQFGEAELGVIR